MTGSVRAVWEGALPFLLPWCWSSSAAGDVQGHDNSNSEDRPLVKAHHVRRPLHRVLYPLTARELSARCFCSLSTCVPGTGLALPATWLNVLYLQEGITVPILQVEKLRLTGVKKLILAVQFMSRSRVLV